MSRPNSPSRGLSISKRAACIALLLFLPVGCTSIGSSPVTGDGLMRFPGSQDAAFRERVESDPFPSANQALGNSLKSQTL